MVKKNLIVQSQSRRSFLGKSAVAAAAVSVGGPLILTSRSASARNAPKLTLVSWGGAYRDAVEASIVKPFTEETGITVTIIDTPDLARVRAQVQTNNVEWDVFDAPSALGVSGANAGLWETLDPAWFDQDDLIINVENNLLPWYIFVGGIIWDPKRHPDGKHPRNFQEFLDVENFPGRRVFRNRPSEMLEVALLGDGVDPSELYPLDVDRAFKALDRVKSSVVSWVDQTPQTLTLIQTGEADFSYSYVSRVKPAQESGISVDFSFDQTVNAFEYLAIVKNAPNKANAIKFLQFVARPDRQAAFMELLGSTPASKSAIELLSPEAKRWIPDLNSKNTVLVNDGWWTTNYDALNRRFREWALT